MGTTTFWTDISARYSCGGDVMDVTGQLHWANGAFQDANGGYHVVSNINQAGVTAVDETTGTRYVWPLVSHIELFFGQKAQTETFTVMNHLVPQGGGGFAWWYSTTYHVTLNADGTVSAAVDRNDVYCT